MSYALPFLALGRSFTIAEGKVKEEGGGGGGEFQPTAPLKSGMVCP